MKIGVLTYQRAHNYGALLQAFALKTFVQKLDYEVDIIDYWPSYHSQDYKLIPNFNNRSFLSKVFGIIQLFVGSYRIFKRRKGYHDFMRKQLNLSGDILYKDSKDLSNAKYDIVIYGSDQIWRNQKYLSFKGFDLVYFGEGFSKSVKRIAYAASMGVIKLTENDKSFLNKKLKTFKFLSVREDNLKNELSNIISTCIKLVLDPVFLLSKNEWEKYLPKKTKLEKYILLYQISQSNESLDLVNKLQKHLGYKVVEIHGRVNPFVFGSRYKQDATPFEFLSLINNAEFIISTSFHGTAFSVLFEKQFFAIGMGNNSSRVESLLLALDISSRYINDASLVDFSSFIDYKVVSEKLEVLKNDSITFIKDSLC